MTRALVLASLLAPAVAAAEPTAKQLVDAGLATFNVEDYDVASRYFERAYKLDPAPAYIYSWAQAERLGGHCDKARELYTRYLSFELTPQQREVGRSGLALCPVVVRNESQPPPPPVVVLERPWYGDKVADGLVVSGAIGIGVGLAYMVGASNLEASAHSAQFLDDFRADLDNATTHRRVGITGLAVGTALAAAGVTVFLLRRHHVTTTTDGHAVAVSLAW